MPSAIVLRIDLFLRFLEGNLWPLGQHGIACSNGRPAKFLSITQTATWGCCLLQKGPCFEAQMRSKQSTDNTTISCPPFGPAQVCDKAAKVQREWKEMKRADKAGQGMWKKVGLQQVGIGGRSETLEITIQSGPVGALKTKDAGLNVWCQWLVQNTC